MEDTGESTGSIRLARRDQRSLIPHHAHAPAPSPSRRWSIRCIAFALVTDGNLGTPLAPRFRLRFGCAPLHSGLRSAIRCAPFLRSAPARRPSDRSALEPSSVTALNRSHPKESFGGGHRCREISIALRPRTTARRLRKTTATPGLHLCLAAAEAALVDSVVRQSELTKRATPPRVDASDACARIHPSESMR